MTNYIKKCEICRREFRTNRNTQKLCSLNCRSKHYNNLFKHKDIVKECLECNQNFIISFKYRN